MAKREGLLSDADGLDAEVAQVSFGNPSAAVSFFIFISFARGEIVATDDAVVFVNSVITTGLAALDSGINFFNLSLPVIPESSISVLMILHRARTTTRFDQTATSQQKRGASGNDQAYHCFPLFTCPPWLSAVAFQR